LVNDLFTTKTRRRQIDIFSHEKSLIVEFDGPLHFENIFGDEDFESKKRKDAEINSLRDQYCIIRVSYDCYSRRHGFDATILEKIRELLTHPHNGLFLLGSKYGENYKL
jgi:very-short-patch-repair endonuclease